MARGGALDYPHAHPSQKSASELASHGASHHDHTGRPPAASGRGRPSGRAPAVGLFLGERHRHEPPHDSGMMARPTELEKFSKLSRRDGEFRVSHTG
jgi:hypothetical protein